jgi:hypothetical protein
LRLTRYRLGADDTASGAVEYAVAAANQSRSKEITNMLSTISNRAGAASAGVGGALLAASGALQATGLDWTENAVKTPSQHVTMAFFAAALVTLVPAVGLLGRTAGGPLGRGWLALAVGQIGVAAASSVSNARGVDAGWFPAAAIAANALWIVGTLVLATALFRNRHVPRLLALGLVVAYVGSIPLSILGGGIVAGVYWLALSYLLSPRSGDRPALLPA